MNEFDSSAKFIWLVRHAQSTANRDFIIQGHHDAPLTELGLHQAEKTAEFFAQKKELFQIKNLFSSDLSRAKQTATAISNKIQLPLVQEKSIREAYFGRWEGRLSKDIVEREPEVYSRWRLVKTWRPAWCESYSDLQERGIKFIQNLIELSGNSVVVSHGGLINAIIDHFDKKPLSECSNLILDNCSISALKVINDEILVSTVNYLAPEVPLTRFKLEEPVVNLPAEAQTDAV
ncbi:MAG: histidine phosphatase family protein [Candidatus Caenarcaniphilales bacterium]|nr:histidine phosphatase family protein [Candidatus Caenarcaniphilales bacterium]